MILLKYSSKQVYKVQQTYFFLAHLGSYWNDTWFLLNLLPISDWLLYQQGLIMLFCWQKTCPFFCYFFWYKIPPIFRWQTRNFPQFFSNGVSNSVALFSWILARFSRLWVLVLKIYWLFCPSRKFSAYNFIYRNVEALIFQVFKVHGFMDVCAKFLNQVSLMKEFYWGLKLEL